MVATRQPHLVQSLTLAEPSLFALLVDQPDGKAVLEAWGKQFQPIVAAVKAGDLVGATKLLAAVVSGEPVEHFDKLPRSLRQILLDNARTLGALLANPEATVPCESLRALKIPTLVIRGERTPQIFVKTNEAVTRCVAGSRPLVIPNASHAMSYDNPAAFNEAVLAFLEGR
jgi:pimeloyl-ACP methyl ester carboxylesterase